MLTLTRKVGESIRIGDDVQIIVKEIRKNQVRIGIVAPQEVKIYREEVYENIVAEHQAAAPPTSRTQPEKPDHTEDPNDVTTSTQTHHAEASNTPAPIGVPDDS